MPLPVVGLTGNIACGKSTVAQLLVSRGAALVCADEVARAVVEPGSDGLHEVVEAFGREVLGEDGTLDRPALGQRIFGDADARNRLNAILHPRIGYESMRRIEALQESDASYIVYDAALLVENGTYRAFAALLVVRLDPARQRERLMSRNGLSEDEATQRITSQMPQEEKVAVADYVIDNDGSLADLEAHVQKVHDALMIRFGKDGA